MERLESESNDILQNTEFRDFLHLEEISMKILKRYFEIIKSISIYQD